MYGGHVVHDRLCIDLTLGANVWACMKIRVARVGTAVLRVVNDHSLAELSKASNYQPGGDCMDSSEQPTASRAVALFTHQSSNQQFNRIAYGSCDGWHDCHQ